MDIFINGEKRRDVTVNEIGYGFVQDPNREELAIVSLERLDLTVPAPVVIPPPAPDKWRWAGQWAEMDAVQEARGLASILASWGGRPDVMHCVCQPATSSIRPTKANREKHFSAAGAGDTLIVGFDLWVQKQGLDIPAFRTWCDTESLTVASNEGSRLADKSLHLAFNEKWAGGANRVDFSKPPLPLDRWVRVEFENRMHPSAGRAIIRQDGEVVLDYTGATMGPEVDRVQFGVANDSRLSGVTAWYAAPSIEIR